MAQRKSARNQRRARERAQAKLVARRQRLAALEPGGSPERPLDVESASLIEVRAEATPCLRCEGRPRVDEHRAETAGEQRLRVVTVRCSRCGEQRIFYFRIVPRLLD